MLNKEYESELLMDFLITRDNTDKIMEEYKDEIVEMFDYATVLNIYSKIGTPNLYSKEQIDNFKKVLSFIIQNRDLNKEDETETKCLIGIKDDIKNIEASYDFYYLEFTEKFNDLDNFIDNNYQMIDKEKIELSVQYDYLVYQYLTKPFTVSNGFKLIINPNFILSINKFLSEKPELFKDEEIKTKTIISLKLIETYNKEKNIKTDERINDLVYLIKTETQPIDIQLLKDYNMLLLIHKVIVDNRKIEDTEYKDLILTDYFIENLNKMLQHLKTNSTGKYYGYDVKERLKYVLFYILDKRNDNKTKIKYNEMMFLLDKIAFSKLNYFLYDEAEIKYTQLEFLKKFIVRLIFGSNISLEEDMKVSIARDYDAFQLLLSKEDIDLNKIDPYYIRSIKKFQMDIPEIFSNNRVLERVDKILTSEKVLKKR